MTSLERRFVYVLRSQSEANRYYVGLTNNVERRVVAHNGGQSRHTARYRPWILHVAMEFSSEDVAARFERYLKSGSGRAFARRHFG